IRRAGDLGRGAAAGMRVLAILLCMWCPEPAAASHAPIVIDGDLTDLISAINANLGSENGGFAIPDEEGEVCTPTCCFANGYDIQNYYAFVDFKNANGSRSEEVTLFAGWEATGVIGDVDGDGDPS